jgi:hypothetical protein
MADHSGGYMLNEVIGLLEREQIFEFLGKERSSQLLLEITRLAERRYDCRSYDILEGHTDKLAFCYLCLTLTDDLIDGRCKECRKYLVDE